MNGKYLYPKLLLDIAKILHIHIELESQREVIVKTIFITAMFFAGYYQ